MGNSLLCFWIYLDFEIALFTSFVFGLISFFGSIAFLVNNVLIFGAFGCSSFVNNSRDWIDVYNIFLYSNISINCRHFSSVVINSCAFSSDSLQHIAVDYLLMLTIFHVQNVLIILN